MSDQPQASPDGEGGSALPTITPFTDDELHWLACEIDHDLKNTKSGENRFRWTNLTMARMLATVGARTNK